MKFFQITKYVRHLYDRVNTLYAFQCTGLDYARPLFIRNNTDTTLKVYILLFTCASSRALHLELIPDMRELAFIRAFERFTAKQGIPDVIILRLLNHRLSRNLCCFFEFDRNSYYLAHLGGWVLRAINEISENVIKKESWKIIVKLWRTRDCFAQNRNIFNKTNIFQS